MNIDWQTIFETILPFLPASLAGDATTIITFIVALAAVVARFWPRPSDSSKWLPLYLIVNGLAMNGKHAANADDRKP
ncbi:hypothetical protein [Asaia astilbis]|uniref:hypothetical protein n=1 Tax=Asaia astilbis TaxID=610244 RepID=UPI000687A96A|nr:hypothetical protein [Asaia astilbis]